ncbi:MAG: hypothetical protein B6242_07535 [Anaerolineaceae bacterium 4572_78]|nr:MAG: hypothetical protein B6242_07535 [Anaerolineaceae bacterium 4572_78]
MKIEGQNYIVTYDSSSSTICCEGAFRLRGMAEYSPIMELLDTVANQKPKNVILNLTGLKFMNSSGINVISKFVIKLRRQKSSDLVVLCTSKYPWQIKSLRNLERLMPGLKLEVD